MKWSFASIGVVLLGLIGIAVILLFQQLTTNNENDYYLLKEVTEAAMIDAVDLAYYRETGDLKIVREKFVENFTRRFAESTLFAASEYTIEFYDIMEIPPKVSVIIRTNIGEYTINGNSDEYGIANKLDAILEYTGKDNSGFDNNGDYNNPYIPKTITVQYYAMPDLKDLDNGNFSINHSLQVPSELIAPNIKNIKIQKVTVDTSGDINQEELNYALLKRELSYNVSSSVGKDTDPFTNYMYTIDTFSTDIVVNEYSFCNDDYDGSKFYNCNEDNKYRVKMSGKSNDYDGYILKGIYRYSVVWSYDEYEFLN